MNQCQGFEKSLCRIPKSCKKISLLLAIVFALCFVGLALAKLGAFVADTDKGTNSAKDTGSPPVRDIDGNIYGTVKIGKQIWMADNLKVTRYKDGSMIPSVWDSQSWSTLNTGALCWQNNDPKTGKELYGALYNFFAVADPRGLAPEGWHIPSIEEWRVLELFLGGADIAGGKMKDFESGLWKTPQNNTSNTSGFSALPAGGRGRLGIPGEAGNYATWWTSTSCDTQFSWHWGLFSDKSGIRSNPGHKNSGFSVRCIKDDKSE